MKSRFSAGNSETLASEVAALAGASRTDLTSRWRALYEPKRQSASAANCWSAAITYRLQELRDLLNFLTSFIVRSCCWCASDTLAMGDGSSNGWR
jgi:hypothetical protein